MFLRTLRLPLLAGDLLLGLLAIGLTINVVLAKHSYAALLRSLEGGKVLLFLCIVLFASFVVEVYSYERQITRQEIAIRILFAMSFSFFMLALADLLVPGLTYDQGVLITAIFAFGFLQFLWHACYRTWDRMSGFANRVLILGCGPTALQMGELLDTPNKGHLLLGYFSCSANTPAVGPEDILGRGEEELCGLVEERKASKVVVALTERRGVFPLKELLHCKLRGVEVLDAPTFYEQMTGKLMLESITPSWFIFSDGFRVTAVRRMLKRMLDVLCSMLGVLLLLPLIPLVALAIKLDSRGPVLFRQERVGEGEQGFTLYKFRTMRQDAEEQSGAVWSGEDDPRITRVGGLLRKIRLDEAPQLFNVLLGDMSFVGPRPERPEFVTMLKEVIPYYSERHCVKPGITGWAQVSYSYGSSVEDAIEKLRYDLYYVKNLSLSFDILIILKTIHVVLFGKGGR